MNGRRIVVGVLVGSLIGSVIAAQAADARTKKHVRTAKGTYATPSIGAAGAGGGGNCGQNGSFGCVEFPIKASEHHVTLSITDSAGQAVYASAAQSNTSGTVTQTTPIGDFCGKTTTPLSVSPGWTLTIYVWEGPGPNPPCAGVATQGTVAATFGP
jgi:hypothetical protein